MTYEKLKATGYFEDQPIKNDQEKNRLDLLPFRALEDVGLALTYGANKYDDNNWRKGFAYSRLSGAALRHLFAWCRCEDIDEESGLPHLAMCIASLLFLLETIKTGTGTDDRYKY